MKKGSKEAKAWGRKMKRLRKGNSKPIKQKQTKMAKRKRRSYAKVRRTRKRSSSMFGLGGIAIGAIAYGAIRQKMSNALIPITAKVPLGSVADEATMLISLILTKKFIGRSVPLVSQICSAGQYIELSRIGEEIASGSINFGGSKQTTNSYFA